MNADRRILTPVAATLLGGVFVGIATLGGTLSGSAPAVAAKTDRFATAGDSLCEGQSWPNLSPECLSWVEGAPLGKVRFITVATHDRAAQTTTLTRVRDASENVAGEF
jgi:hypothetical protein